MNEYYNNCDTTSDTANHSIDKTVRAIIINCFVPSWCGLDDEDKPVSTSSIDKYTADVDINKSCPDNKLQTFLSLNKELFLGSIAEQKQGFTTIVYDYTRVEKPISHDEI